jgi:hypothetical protein
MAKNQTFPMSTRSAKTVSIAGSFAPNGSSAVSASSREGCGFTVARTSAGLFTITLSDKFTALISAVATVQQGTGGDQFCQIGAVSMANKTIAIRVWDISGAAETDIAADASNRINFHFVLLASDSARRRGD